MGAVVDWCERGLVPDRMARWGMRLLNEARLWEECSHHEAKRRARQEAFIRSLRCSPIALETDAANRQHYEVPADFFLQVLGPHLKYSCCHYERDDATLADAEQSMLKLTAQRAGLRDGMELLELGCGWGSLSLWMAAQYPNSRILAISNSHSQKAFIDQQSAARGLSNLTIQVANAATFDTADRFDRVVSVEMFEHMRNYDRLLANIARWLKPEGRLFVHYFCHRSLAYPFVAEGESNWMARYFFTGGMMPSFDLLRLFPEHLTVESDWWVSGRHYQRTANDWCKNLDVNHVAVGDVMNRTYGAEEASIWLQRWRMFFMACAELFGTDDGATWGVGHYLLRPRA